MKAAIYGRQFSNDFIPYARVFFSKLETIASNINIHENFTKFLQQTAGLKPKYHQTFNSPFKPKNSPDILFSIGGDGTFLDSAEYVGKLNIPMVGINSGRLGFLANISESEIEQALEKIKHKQYSQEERILLKAESAGKSVTHYPYCLNEITIQKQSTDSMIITKVQVDNNYLNSYWADGLIVATPTGSTAYSLSVGGPIMLPEAQSIIIIPIAPHNLTVRPIIIPDTKKITIKVESRSGKYLCSADSRTELLQTSETIEIKTADFKLKTILPKGKTFYDTLRNKLMWGLDKRN